MSLSALALNCSLNASPTPSSTALLLKQVTDELETFGVTTETLRAADYDIKPGVEHDMGNGDQWPTIRDRILAADIFVLGGPVWMGSPSSITKRVAERLDAVLSDADDQGRLPTFGKVAIVAVVGNEDGAHHVSAEVYQWLNDVGFSIPAAAVTYWVGEAMGSVDYKDLDETPEKVKSTTKMAASNAVHLANLLKTQPFTGIV